jgi:hypothetical protein
MTALTALTHDKMKGTNMLLKYRSRVSSRSR